jgi:pyrroloquinoline quinone (PQQ) biosynthesis protein C
MVAELIKTEIDNYLERLKRTSPLFQNARNGKLQPENIANYVFNIRHLVSQTQFHLALARKRASMKNSPSLAQYFASKMQEEAGHEVWGDEDLERIRARYGKAPTPRVSSFMKKLIDEIEESIERNPALYVVYMLFAEYQTVAAGPEILELMETNCQIPKEMISVVGNHIELDRDHAEEGLKCADEFLTDSRTIEEARITLLRFITLFEGFCSEMGEVVH